MNLDVKQQYVVSLNSQELRLVGLALARKLKDGADVIEADELNRKLCQAKAHALNQHLEVARGALAAAEKEAPNAT